MQFMWPLIIIFYVYTLFTLKFASLMATPMLIISLILVSIIVGWYA